MKIDDETVAKFAELYEKEFKEKLTSEGAYDRFLRVLNLLRVVYSKKD